MAIDREASLRKAEKLLRQGRLDGAIQEYARLLEEQPNDWNTRNVLGDLYVRANQVEQAAAQFTKIADHFAQEGFFPKAIALYKKVCKIKPDDEHALLQAAEISAQQGLLAEAKGAFVSIADQRRKRGDKSGSNELLIRVATLDPADLGACLAAARAAAETGDAAAAATRYKEVAAELFRKERAPEAIDALAEAVSLDPADETTRDSLVGAYLERGEIEEARRYAATGFHYRAIADELSARGMEREALDALFEAVTHDPADTSTRVRLARSLIAGGEIERAASCLAPDSLGEDPDLLLVAAEVDLRTGRNDAGRQLLRAVIERDTNRRDDVVQLGCRLTELDWDAGFDCVDVVVDVLAAAGEWAGAAGCLQQFLKRAATHIAALIKLVDICVDGDLDESLMVAQAQLADAYLLAGRAFEARVIAEDLVTRAPGDAAHIDRFRRALVKLGEPDPDAVIADRLNHDPALDIEEFGELEAARELPPPEPEGSARVLPFARSGEPPDRSAAPGAAPVIAAARAGADGAPAVTARPADTAAPRMPAEIEVAEQEAALASAAAGAGADTRVVRPVERASTPVAADVGRADPPDVYELGTMAIDLNAVLGEEKAVSPRPPEPRPVAAADTEIDLNAVLANLGAKEGSPPPASPKAAAPPAARGGDLDAVFEEMRHEVAKEQATNSAAQHYKLALTYHDMGMTADCIKALETAARSPRYRFQAASLLARIHRGEGRMPEAIDWFERAAEAPASSVEAGRALLYELGQALEDEGEAVRALAVYLELGADAGDYKDVSARIKRLSR